ncbi:MAG: hypothetical protein ACE5EY_01710 [Anaerolineae bacterium]
MAEWLELFGPEPETKLPPPRRRIKPSKGKRPSPAKPSRKKPLRIAKESEEPLDQDDIDAWLEIFGDNS